MILLPQKKLIIALRRISYEAPEFAFFSAQREIHADHSYVVREFGFPGQDSLGITPQGKKLLPQVNIRPLR